MCVFMFKYTLLTEMNDFTILNCQMSCFYVASVSHT